MSVAKGVVTLTGQESLNGLGVTLTPTREKRRGRHWLAARLHYHPATAPFSRPARTSSG